MKIFLIFLGILGAVLTSGYAYLAWFQEGYEGEIKAHKHTLIVFDFDGTLCDSWESAIEAFNGIAPTYGLKQIDLTAKATLKSVPMKAVLDQHGVTTWKLPLVVWSLRKQLRAKIPDMKSFEGMREALAELKSKDVSLGIMTTNSLENVKMFLAKESSGGFDFIYHGSSVFGKARLLKYIKQASTATRIIYVGDETRDIDAARETGVESAAVTWGYQAPDLLKAHNPDFLIRLPKDMVESLM